MFSAIHTRFMQVSRVATWVGGGALLLSAIMVTLDVTARKLFGVTISGSDEITGYVFAAATTWAYSYVLFTRSNIRIDALYTKLGARPRAFLDLVGLSLLLYYIYLLTAKSVFLFLESFEQNATAPTTLATPLWIPQIFWVSGLCFFFLSLAFLTLYSFTAFIRGDWSMVNKIAGVKSVSQEIEEETHV